MENQQQKRNKNKKKKILILLLLLLLLIGFIVGIVTGLSRDDGIDEGTGTENVGGGIGLTVDPNAGEYVPPVKEDTAPTKGVAIPGWGTITIPANQKSVTVDFYNPDENAELYYLTFELRLLDDSKQGYEVLYKSGLVEPGKHIQKIELSKGLAKGEYQAVVHVQPYRMDEAKTPTNNADMKTKLVVK